MLRNENELPWRTRGRLWLRLLIRFLIGLALVLTFWKLGLPLLSLCMPFVVALILTWLLEPLMRFLISRTILNRKAVAILLLLLIFGICGGLVFGFGQQIAIQIQAVAGNWNDIWREVSTIALQLTEQINEVVALLPEQVQQAVTNLTSQLLDWLQKLGTQSILPKTTSFAMSLPNAALSAIFFLMATYFIMSDYPRVGAVVTDWMPVNLKAFLRFLEKTFQVAFGGYIRAELMLSSGVFIILVIGFTIIGQPYGLLIALIFAVLDFIPIIGAGTVMVPWAVIELALGDWRMAVKLMVIWSIIVVFRRVLEPKFLGSYTGLHPILSLLSIYIGMKTFGVLGMVLAPTLLLVALSVCASGVFDGLVYDVKLAFADITAFLQGDRPPQRTSDTEPIQEETKPQEKL